ncbi:cytochrome P450 4V2-like, partial [Centruroides vittatus]|uniref:cytochrome P450 4V2-like n=1 Tax=Centruroides vittatus TaxID=120091 RepID=UPI00350F5EBD
MEAFTVIFASNFWWKILAIIIIIYILYKFLVKGKQIFICFKEGEFYYFLLRWKLAFQLFIPRIGSSMPYAEMFSHTYDKGYFPFNLLIVKYLFLYRPDYIQTILSDSQCINKSKVYNGFKDWIGDSIFMKSDEAHTERKKLLLPAFRLNVLHSFILIMEKNARELVEVLTEKEKVFIVPVVKQCGFNVLYDTILGVKGGSTFRKQSSYYEKLINITFKPVLDRSINFLLSFDFFFYLTSKGREFKSNKEIIRKFTKEIISEKIRLRENEQNTIEINGNPKSLLDILLDARDKNPKQLTIESICEEIEFFLGA